MATRLLLIAFLFSSIYQLNALDSNAYIVTKDDKIITGRVIEIFYTEGYTELTFVNETGSIYQLYPYLIKGFVYKKQDKQIIYESKYMGGAWHFLRLIEHGDGVRLYRCADMKHVWVRDDITGLKLVPRPVKEFWIQPEWSEQPLPLYRFSFRKRMRQVLSKYPEIADKIGDKGYRWGDMNYIIQEYNRIYMERKQMM